MSKTNPLTREKHKKAWDSFNANHFSVAKLLYQQICEKDRIDDYALTMLGVIHGLLNELDEAKHCLKKALIQNQCNFDAAYNLGRTYYGLGQFNQAILSYKKALLLKPDHADTLIGLGLSYIGMDEWTQAQQFYEHVLQQNPKHAGALDNLANVMVSQGRAELAIPYYRQALAANPRTATYSNLLLCLHYPAPHDPLAVFQEHFAWGALQARGYIAPNFQHTNRSSNRKLRIGYVTPDLRCHSVVYFIEPLLLHHDRSQFEIFCYLELGVVDDMTKRLLEFAGTVKNTSDVSNEQVAAMIRKDKIDILVDLAGHTNQNRLLVFAQKPAPIQMTYLGYPNTTGLPMIGYRLTDALVDPPGMTEHLHTEELVRLENGFLCFTPPAESPQITPLPSIQKGYITFGSFNTLAKITAEILEIWAQILLRVPDSRLLIKNAQLTDVTLQRRLHTQLVQLGVDSERVDFIGRTSKEEHMAAFSRVDIALDTFPYHGTTTTCDTLWMGVPVITLAGESHVSRVGVSLLTRIGLSELIADAKEGYIENAVRLANSGKKLSHLRQNLRVMFEDSGLCDGLSFTQNVESAYRRLWQEWCIAN